VTAVLSPVAVTVDLEATCLLPSCAELAWRFKRQLGTAHYSRGAAVMETPATLADWRTAHRTARKRADHAARLGYRFAEIDRSFHNDAIHEINTSLEERQGRPMSDGYRTRHNHGPLPAYPCGRHRVHTYGVLEADVLRAYLTLYRVGELGLVSMILGHGDHLARDIMYLLAAGVIGAQAGQGGVLYYNLWSSGTDGLRYYKTKIGFEAADVEWRL
jgi:hypothetical protein